MTFEDFMTHWSEVHAKLIQKNARELGIVKYIQIHRTSSSTGGSTRQRYDGIAEVWYESEDHFRALGKSDSGRVAVQSVVEDQRKFIGRETPLFKGYESAIING